MKLNLLFFSFICALSSCFAQNEILKDSIAASFAYNESEILNAEYLLTRLSKIDVSLISVIKLVGYTDSIGSVKRNKALAADRIRAVESLLRNHSFSQVKVETVNANELSGSRAAPDELNRRVDVLFYGKEEAPKLAAGFQLNTLVNLDINFKGGTDEFLMISYPKLRKLLNYMIKDTTLFLELHGHVCCADDQPLSDKRAFAVLNYLMENGVSKKRMNAKGFSNRKLLVPDDSESNMSRNRRVEAIFFRKE